MLKTRLEWLNELPYPYKEQALKNIDVPSHVVEVSIHAALSRSFSWDSSPEGAEYWERLFNSIPIEKIDYWQMRSFIAEEVMKSMPIDVQTYFNAKNLIELYTEFLDKSKNAMHNE
jgi:hypothetical protein